MQSINDKKNVFLVIILAFILSSIIFSWQFSQGQHMNYYVDGFSQSMSIDEVSDIDFSGDMTMRIIGENPSIIYSLPEKGDYMNGRVQFAQTALDAPFYLHIYAAEDITKFSKERVIDVLVDGASIYFDFALPVDDGGFKYIRIDFDKQLSELPKISSINLQYDELNSRLCSFGLGIIHDGLLLVPVMSLMLIVATFYFFHSKDSNDFKRDFAAIIIMAVSLFLLYFDYLLGDKAFSFYNEIGSDSFIQTYPNLLSQAKRIANGTWKEYVNFNKSLGQCEGALVLEPGNWFCIFGESAVLKWVGIGHYLKVLLAGILAYYWAKVYSGNSETGIIIAFAYAMSSEFTVRGIWYSYPNTALFLIVWLLAFELKHKKGKGYLFPFATVLLFYQASVYYCLVWGSLLAAYILFRLIIDKKDKFEWKNWFYTEVFYFFFALIGMADTLISQMEATFSSSRFTEASSGFSFLSNLVYFDKDLFFSSLLRTLGETIMGISDDFMGYMSFLEGPAFYCGILLFLLIPVSIYNSDKRRRLCYAFIICASWIYIMVSPLRVVANGFAGNSFKLSSHWICVFMLVISMDILSMIFENKALRKGSLAVFQITVIIMTISLLLAVKEKYVARVVALMISVLFLVIYTIIMQYIYSESAKKKFLLQCLCLVFATETIVMSWATVNDRNMIKLGDLRQKKYYNDYTVEALEYIKENNDRWYRLEKAYSSVGLSDSPAQDYYGIVSYIGGTEVDPGIQAIYQALELTRGNNGYSKYHYLMGTGGNIYASSLLGVKYYLTKYEITDRYGLQFVTKVGDVFIYENKLALPIAYTYKQTISEEDFNKLSLYDRNRNILKSCVTDLRESKIMEAEPSVFDFSQVAQYQQKYEQSAKWYQTDVYDSKVLIARIVFSKEGDTFQSIHFVNDSGKICAEDIIYDKGERVIESYCNGLQSFRFSDIMYENMNSVEFYAIDAEQYYSELEHDVADLQNNAMEIRVHDNIYNYIEGTITCEQPRILATSIPISDKWKIRVDGQNVEVMTVNKGFVGCCLEQGEHVVEIYYDGKTWLEANIFKVIGFLITLMVLVVGIYKEQRKGRKENDKYINSSSGI